jgi:hypothetical protein
MGDDECKRIEEVRNAAERFVSRYDEFVPEHAEAVYARSDTLRRWRRWAHRVFARRGRGVTAR